MATRLDQKIWSARALRASAGRRDGGDISNISDAFIPFEPLEKDVVAIKYVYD